MHISGQVISYVLAIISYAILATVIVRVVKAISESLKLNRIRKNATQRELTKDVLSAIHHFSPCFDSVKIYFGSNGTIDMHSGDRVYPYDLDKRGYQLSTEDARALAYQIISRFGGRLENINAADGRVVGYAVVSEKQS